MRTKLFLICTVFLGVSMVAQARGGGMIMRGGQGFLFPDHNSFANPGQFSMGGATAVEAFYKRSTATTPNQTATPSVVYGNGSFGFGVYGERTGTDLMTGASDEVGGGLGFALMKDRVTLGAKYVHTLGSSTLGDVTGTLNFNPAGQKGFGLGLGYTRDLGAGTHSATAAVGYAFMGNNNIEVDITFPSIGDFSNYNLAATFTMMKQMIYLGGGYLMANTGTMNHGAVGRLGFVLGSMLDFSVWGQYFFITGSAIEYGGSLRATF